MKKNKGFTLIELLAVIVILGILAVFSIPMIMGLIEKSRNKVYITDAKKLITQAEYRIKASNTDIEKPDPGDCIAISLVYLDSDDFDSPPNGGKYVKENSFVIVKNNAGKLEYSATLVEKMKGGAYRGIDLTSSAILQSGNALSRVKNFKESDLVYVEDDLTNSYINSKLGKNYISGSGSVTAIYNYPSSLTDSSSTAVTDSKPKILKATLVSTSNKEYNSLDTTLSLKVKDDDTPRSKLTVYYSFKKDELTNATPYGSAEIFTKNFDFSDKYVYDGSTITMYITVKDADGNTDKTTKKYVLHKNTAPQINVDKTSITNGSADVSAGVKSLVRFSVTDDIDDASKLSVCVAETSDNNKPTTCNSYKKFNEVFSNFDENLYAMDYVFTNCPSGCKRDGSTHYLTFFVKDSYGAISSEMFSYKFSTNANPTIKKFDVKSVSNSFPYEGNKSVKIDVDVTDDSDNLGALKFTISDGVKTEKFDSNSSNGSNSFDFTLDKSFKYDGSSKNITVKVDDADGGSAYTSRSYTLYKNTAPVIDYFNVESNGVACGDEEICPVSDGGSLNVKVDLQLSDDLDTDNNYSDVKVCVSQNQSDCNNKNNLSNYTSYANYYDTEKPIKLTGDYNTGGDVTIYAYAIDSYNEMSSAKTVTYTLYKDKPPVIDLFDVRSDEESFTDEGSLNIIYNIEATDDFDSAKDLNFELLLDNTVIESGKLNNYIERDNKIKLPGNYDGRTVTLTARVLDKNGQIVDSNVSSLQYTIYTKDLPVIEDIQIESVEEACKDEDLCSNSENNSLSAKYKIFISNLIYDDSKDLQVCVSETENCTNYTNISDYYNISKDEPIEKVFNFTPTDSTKPYDGSTKTLHVYVKDNSAADPNNNYVSRSQDYTIYENNAPKVVYDPDVDNKGENFNLPNIDYSVGVLDDLDKNLMIKYCYEKDGGGNVCPIDYQNYSQTINLNNDNFFKIGGYRGQEFNIYAVIKDSYGVETETSRYNYAIYEDVAPVIDDIVAVVDNPIYNENKEIDEFHDYKISFTVLDYLDQYYYCISNNENSCSNYSSTAYDGSDGNFHVIDIGNNIFGEILDQNNFESKTYYLFIKDGNGNVVKQEFVFSRLYICDERNLFNFKYEYFFDSNKTYYDDNNQQVTNNQKITMNSCNGKCYYHPTDNNIISYYDRKIVSQDRFNEEHYCPKNSEESTGETKPYKTGCDFKDCYYKDGSYERRAIGLERHDVNVPFVAEVGGTTYVCTGYYRLYLSSYNQYDENITLSLVKNEKICAEAVEDGKYDYKSSDANPYVRVDKDDD